MSRTTLLNTDTEDLRELLGNGKIYDVPPFQRDYSWTEENWQDLWDDISQLDESSADHYMGALVLQTTDRRRFTIIDGQQRLATLSILILSCIHHLREMADHGVDSEDNRSRAELLIASYIGGKDPTTLLPQRKLRLNRHDDGFYESFLIPGRPHPSPRNLRGSESLLLKAYQFFRARLGDYLGGRASGEDVTRLANEVVALRLLFITVNVRDQLSAYTVFETLNARGLELTETDLLKNYLFSILQNIGESQLATLAARWESVADRVGASRFPSFLRHHVNSGRPFVRQRQLFRAVKSQVSTGQGVLDLLESLEVDSYWYAALSDGFDDHWLDFPPNAREAVRILGLVEVSQFTPLVLAAKDRFKPDEIAKVLALCSAQSIRFNLTGRRNTHPLEPAFNKAALAIRDGSAATTRSLLPHLSDVLVGDEDFERDFAALRMAPRGHAKKRVRYLLVEIERRLGNNSLHHETIEASIEHILPESPGPEWEQAFNVTQMERGIDRLGNLTLLEASLNRECANKRFEEKRSLYARSQFEMTRRLADFEEWTEEAINARQRGFAKLARQIWRLPFD